MLIAHRIAVDPTNKQRTYFGRASGTARFAWMFDVTKCAVQEAIIDLGSAFRSFFEKRGRYPRFKKKGGRDSFCAANEAGTFRVEWQRIKLPS